MLYPVRLWPMVVRFWLTDRLPRWIAMRLPRKVALFAFIRVYAVLGTCGPEYDAAYKAWERRDRC